MQKRGHYTKIMALAFSAWNVWSIKAASNYPGHILINILISAKGSLRTQ